MKPRICVNCGATLHSNKCEYCDTEYEQCKNEQEILELQRKITAEKLKMLNNIQPRPLLATDLLNLSVPLQMSRYEDYKNKLTECCCDSVRKGE